MLQQVLDWLAGLPGAALYGALGIVAAIENIFPPVPADTVVAFGSFLAGRTGRSVIAAFLAVWIGNVAGAMLMYAVGRRYGADRLAHRMGGGDAMKARARMETLYGRYGTGALFLSRFLPGVRGFVPPFAGALRVPAVRATAVMAAASAVWYGAIAVVAYRVGDDWQAMLTAVKASGRWIGIGALVVTAAAALTWYVLRKRKG